MRYEEIVKGLEAFNGETAKEEYEVSAGLKDEQDMAAIAERYARLFTAANSKMLGLMEEAAWSGATRDRIARVRWSILDGRITRSTAKHYDRVANAELKAKVDRNDGKLSYFDVTPTLSKEPDPAAREALCSAWLDALDRQINPLVIEANRAQNRLVRAMGFANERNKAACSKGMNYAAFAEVACTLDERTRKTYDRVMAEIVPPLTGRKFPGLSIAHLQQFLHLRDLDHFFPQEKTLEACRATFSGLGLRFENTPNLHVDAEDRPNKDSRAFCAAVEIPEEVYLVFKPVGGAEDCAAFLHEAGHAWHYALTDPALPYEDRGLATSYALTEVYSFLMEMLLQNERWLMEMLGLSADDATEVARREKIVDLFQLRRHLGKFAYEMRYYDNPLNDERNRAIYADCMSRFTGFNYPPERYMADIDADLYSVDYMRAWLTEAALRQHLERNFGGQAWFQSPKAGDFLRTLWHEGDGWENEDLVRSIGAEPWDQKPLLRRYKDL